VLLLKKRKTKYDGKKKKTSQVETGNHGEKECIEVYRNGEKIYDFHYSLSILSNDDLACRAFRRVGGSARTPSITPADLIPRRSANTK